MVEEKGGRAQRGSHLYAVAVAVAESMRVIESGKRGF